MAQEKWKRAVEGATEGFRLQGTHKNLDVFVSEEGDVWQFDICLLAGSSEISNELAMECGFKTAKGAMGKAERALAKLRKFLK